VLVVREVPYEVEEEVEVARAPAPRIHRAPPPPPPREAPPERDFLGVGIHGSGVATEGEKVGISAAENPAMGGIGLHVRGRFSESFGLELSADFLSGSSDDGNLEQSSIPLMAGLTWHILPDTRFQPYLIGGVGVHFTRLEYFGGDYAIDVTELAGQLGGGVEFFITENLALHADLRFQTVFKNLDTKEKIARDCIAQVGTQSGFCNNIHFTDGEDKVDFGVQLQAGVSWYF
jgi:opacity protein-like surface antigen